MSKTVNHYIVDVMQYLTDSLVIFELTWYLLIVIIVIDNNDTTCHLANHNFNNISCRKLLFLNDEYYFNVNYVTINGFIVQISNSQFCR